MKTEANTTHHQPDSRKRAQPPRRAREPGKRGSRGREPHTSPSRNNPSRARKLPSSNMVPAKSDIQTPKQQLGPRQTEVKAPRGTTQPVQQHEPKTNHARPIREPSPAEGEPRSPPQSKRPAARSQWREGTKPLREKPTPNEREAEEKKGGGSEGESPSEAEASSSLHEALNHTHRGNSGHSNQCRARSCNAECPDSPPTGTHRGEPQS